MSIPTPPAAPSPRRDKPLNRWHRNAGVAAAGVLVYLLVTGIPLQFSSQLALGQRYVTSPWILDWYGLQAPELALASGEAVQVGEWVFLEQRAVAGTGPLAGALDLGEYLVVAGASELLLVPRGGDAPAEKTQIGGAIRRIGTHRGTAYLDTSLGTLAADAELLNWRPATVPDEIHWAPVEALTAAASAPYRERFRGRMLTTERWLQDLHSGRFFGTLGALIIDVASALLLLLAVTGLMLWWRFRRA